METKEKEVWREVPGYENYQASSWGRIKSLDRTVIDSMGRKRFYRGRILDGSINKGGYKQFGLSVNNKSRTFTASQIVAMTFLDHTPDGHTFVIDHINGDKTNDQVENLQIVTNRENLSNVCFRKDSKILSSKYVGVYWSKSNSKWRADIQHKGESVYLGRFDNELEASKAYQKALSEINNGMFKPENYKSSFTSKYKGVTFIKQKNRWQSQIWVNGKYKYLGLFNTELEAFNCVQKFKENLSQKK